MSDKDGKPPAEEQKESKKQGEVEQKLDHFINTAFESIHGKPDPKDGESLEDHLKKQVITMTQSAHLFYELMRGHKYDEAWDDDEFRDLYRMFEDDASDENLDKKQQGLDRDEFRKMVTRMAQL